MTRSKITFEISFDIVSTSNSITKDQIFFKRRIIKHVVIIHVFKKNNHLFEDIYLDFDTINVIVIQEVYFLVFCIIFLEMNWIIFGFSTILEFIYEYIKTVK